MGKLTTILLLLSILIITSDGKPFKKAMNLLRKLGDQTLKLIKAYDLDIIKESASIIYYSFKVEIGQKLSEGDSVNIDVFYNKKKDIAQCTHSNSILDCKINVPTITSYLVEISPKKDTGTVVWENVDENKNISIILKVNVTSYTSMTYLDYVDGKWNFALNMKTNKAVTNSLITLNVVTQEKTKKYIAYCIYDGSLFNCNVDSGVKQDDLVYLTNSQEGTSVNWGTVLKEDKQIPRLANLDFVKAYELIYVSNNNWSFKIQIEGSLPENSEVLVDAIKQTSSISYGAANCIYSEKILSCNIGAQATNLIKIKVKKDKATVTWNNLKISEIKIPLNTKLKFTKSYGLLFTGKWNFMIDAVINSTFPTNSTAYIDIIHNSVETTASCELIGGSSKATSNIYCVSDLETQTENDVITINPEKKYGTIEWYPKIEGSQIVEAENNNKVNLTFIDAYDLYYSNNKWTFTVRGKAKVKMNPGGKYVIDINYRTQSKEEDSTATCLLREGMRDVGAILFICVADNSNQNEEDLVEIKYPQSDSSTITWTTGITENYKITLNTELTLVKAYDLVYSGSWSFYLSVKDGILPPDSKVIIDISYNTYERTVNCISINKNCIFCPTIATTSLINLITDIKSLTSSVTWKENLQNDNRIFLVKEMNYLNATNLTFDETDSKWHFNVFTRDATVNSKIIIDILYGNKPSTATCISYSTQTYSCIVDENNQNKLTLIKISGEKTVQSTIRWKNLFEPDYIILSTELTLDQTGYLRTSPDDGETWVFDILVEDENIPEDSKIIIDIYSDEFKTVMYSINVDFGGVSTAICFYHNKKLDCTADSSVKGNKYCISLKTEKTLYSTSSVKKWNKVDKNNYPILLVTSLNYHFCTNIELIEDKYIFYCQVHQSTVVPKGSEMTVDILIGTTPSISYCKADNNTYLKCEVSLSTEEYNKNAENIYLSSKKTDKSTITFTIYENQYLFPIELEFIQAYDGEYVNDYRQDYPFRMLAKGDKLKDGLRMRIKVRHIQSGNYGAGGPHNVEDDVPCEIYGGIFFCHWYCLATKIHSDLDKYYLVFRAEGDDIKWKNPGTSNIYEGSHHNFRIKELKSIQYKESIKSYEFSLDINYSGSVAYDNIPIIMDIYINKKNTYAYCPVDKTNLGNIICTTSEIEYKKTNVIAFKSFNYLGNSDITGISDNQALIGGEYYFIQIKYIYGLKYDSNKWSFKIEPKESLNSDFGDSKTLDIFINSNPSLANCKKSSYKLITCEVTNQEETDLIKLYIDNINSEASLQLLSEKNDGIPFAIDLEFIRAYDLKFDNQNEELSFIIQAKFTGSKTIPAGSVFSTMVTDGNLLREIVFCSQNGNIENNIIILSCKPNNKISKNVLISLYTTKYDYTSITWKTSKIYNILYATELDVYKVDDLEYESDKTIWNFNMLLSDTDLPINSKVEIDLVYNNQDVTGTCQLKEKNKLSCTPNVETQNNNDIFSISPTKKNGSVTYKNDLSKLKFYILTLEYARYSDLKYNDNFKWEFKIILAQTNIEEGTSLSVDILLDGSKGYANCILKSKTLECEINKNGQTIHNEIKLVKNKQNSDLLWINLPDEVDMYMDYKIKYINAYGGFHDNLWKFNIYHEAIDKTRKLYDVYVLLDILVDNVESTALCEISFASFLKCVSQHKNQKKDNIIKIPANSSPKIGTVYFEPILDGEKQINPISLSINYESIDSFVKNNMYMFTIKGTLKDNIEYEIEDDTVTGVEILEDKNKKEVACLTNDIGKEKGSKVEIACLIQENISNNKDVVVSIDENGLSKYVLFNNPPEQMVIKSDSVVPRVIEDTTAPATEDNDKDNGNEVQNKNNGKPLCINYILLFLLLFI